MKKVLGVIMGDVYKRTMSGEKYKECGFKKKQPFWNSPTMPFITEPVCQALEELLLISVDSLQDFLLV